MLDHINHAERYNFSTIIVYTLYSFQHKRLIRRQIRRKRRKFAGGISTSSGV